MTKLSNSRSRKSFSIGQRLSSGMKSRPAFAIASMVQPEILILDEVLSAGDGAFRKKSGIRMGEIIGCGAAAILVSHFLDQIRRLCTKVLWLEKGRQIAFGDTAILCTPYQRYLDKTITGAGQGEIGQPQ